ncbi:PREDICTED: pickpocket protein 28-like [Eufriesea mexicana]|uniref:pickpocket protein 28-like n=1 Tax=Eufriesea mexicana TaxID=516756 RepID=UPI00083BD187|nr:PREDICTED: pickpocket protein 28-like [Eufriesea mexicana]
MYRSKDMILRSRYSKNALSKKESSLTQHYNHDDDKNISENRTQQCLRNLHLSKTVKQYCTNSTLHGLRYIGDSNLSIGERIFWIISFSLAVLTASYYIWFLYKKWTSSPIIISLSPESASLNEFPFPSVTICNMNNVRKSEATRIIAGNDIQEKLLLEDMCDMENNQSTTYFNKSTITWESIMDFLINTSQPCKDMLHLCKWHGNVTDCEKIFNPTMADEGICCNFNSVHKKYLFYNPRDWPDLNITYPSNSIDWNPEIGYKNVPSDSIPWRPYGAGQYYGLTLVLDADAEDYYCSSTASVGFKMLLHNPVETPKIAEFAFSVTPGEETRVIVTPRISTASMSIISVPQKQRKCFFTSERKLRYYRTYTQRNCILECEANFTQKICKCVQYYMPKSSNTPICGKKDTGCATDARRAMEVELYDDNIGITSINLSETPSCNCYPGCFEIGYNVEISQSKLMANVIVSDNYVKKSKEYFTKNMAVVHLFFVESQFTKYMKNDLFGFTEFLCNTGGLLGLFMGFSFLSLVEIVYFATLRLWCRVYKNRHATQDNILHVQPFDSSTNLVYPFVQ